MPVLWRSAPWCHSPAQAPGLLILLWSAVKVWSCSYTFSAFWLWSSVVSVLISVTADMSPTGDLHVTSIFPWGEAALSLLRCSCVLPWPGTLLGAAHPKTCGSMVGSFEICAATWSLCQNSALWVLNPCSSCAWPHAKSETQTSLAPAPSPTPGAPPGSSPWPTRIATSSSAWKAQHAN